jgi:hypothetical protein
MSANEEHGPNGADGAPDSWDEEETPKEHLRRAGRPDLAAKIAKVAEELKEDVNLPLPPPPGPILVGGVDALTDNRTLMLALTAVFAAVALALLGLAIPVTASFVIGWVIIGPALLALDVPAPAAAMFVFYYSVLSEVTPPTARSPESPIDWVWASTDRLRAKHASGGAAIRVVSTMSGTTRS